MANRGMAIAILAGMTVVSGAMIWILLADQAEQTAREMDFTDPDPAEGSFVHVGDESVDVDALSISVATPVGAMTIGPAALRAAVGDTFDPGESICVLGPGCFVVSGDVVAILVADGYEGQAVLEASRAPADASELPGLLQ